MYCRINYLKSFFKFVGLQAVCAIGCILFILVFPGLINHRLGEILYSIVTLVIAFDLFYTAAWTIGSRHRRDINIHNMRLSDGDTKIRFSYGSGAVLGGIYVIFCMVLCLICLTLAKSSTTSVSLAASSVYKLWFVEYLVAFKYAVRRYDILCILIALTPFVPIFSGFVCGISDVNYVEMFLNNVVYKKSK